MILVTGATGYVGGRLVPRLLAAGHRVRVLVRDPARLQGRAWVGDVEVVQGVALQPMSLGAAMHDVTCAYYLIHSMQKHAAGADFRDRDIAAATGFATAARQAGVARIIYLGGLGDASADLSHHLRSRHETGDALRSAGVPVTEFRAAVIVGSGSASFEMIRHLTERLPAMICPRWVYTRVQPIAIDNVLDYLVAAPAVPASTGQVVEIGGADVVTYGGMMLGYAKVRGLTRWLVPVPVLSPRLSSYWVHWVTPIPAEIAGPLIEGLRNEVVVRDDTARTLFPFVQPINYHASVERALAELDAGHLESVWSDALFTSARDVAPFVFAAQDGMLVERRQRLVQAPVDTVCAVFSRIGGDRGWPSFNWLWRVRGVIDRLVGGVGFRRGRRDPEVLRVGDALDFWRVEAVEPGRLLRLRAEMKVPGRAWLQFEASPQADEDGQTLLTQTAFFAPKGLFGLLYWYSVWPIHGPIFSTMIDRLAQSAEREVSDRAGIPDRH